MTQLETNTWDYVCPCATGTIIRSVTSHEYFYGGRAEVSVEIACPTCKTEWTVIGSPDGGITLGRRAQVQARRDAETQARDLRNRMRNEVYSPLGDRLHAHLKSVGRTKAKWVVEINRLFGTEMTLEQLQVATADGLANWTANYVRLDDNAANVLRVLNQDASHWQQLRSAIEAAAAYAKSIQIETRHYDTAIRFP